jgi:hypothetical protein
MAHLELTEMLQYVCCVDVALRCITVKKGHARNFSSELINILLLKIQKVAPCT